MVECQYPSRILNPRPQQRLLLEAVIDVLEDNAEDDFEIDELWTNAAPPSVTSKKRGREGPFRFNGGYGAIVKGLSGKAIKGKVSRGWKGKKCLSYVIESTEYKPRGCKKMLPIRALCVRSTLEDEENQQARISMLNVTSTTTENVNDINA